MTAIYSFERLVDIYSLALCHIPEGQISSLTPLWKARNLHSPVYWAAISVNSTRWFCNIAVVNLSVPDKVPFYKVWNGENFFFFLLFFSSSSLTYDPYSLTSSSFRKIVHTDVFCFPPSYLNTHRFQTLPMQSSHLNFGLPAFSIWFPQKYIFYGTIIRYCYQMTSQF
jgi:hypothetical protein